MTDTSCPKCNFDEHLEDAFYCQECGTYLINECTNDDCDSNNLANNEIELIHHNAKYCHHCGSHTTFNESGFFK